MLQPSVQNGSLHPCSCMYFQLAISLTMLFTHLLIICSGVSFIFFQKPGIPLPRPEAGSFLFFVYFLLISSQLLAKLFPLNLFAPRPSFRCSSLPNPSLIHVPDKSFFREFYFLDVMQDFMDMLIQASEFYHLFDLELVGIQKVCWSTHFLPFLLCEPEFHSLPDCHLLLLLSISFHSQPLYLQDLSALDSL